MVDLSGMMPGRKLERVLRESTATLGGYMTDAIMRLKQEDVGWKLLSGGEDKMIPFAVIREHANRARRLAALNPIVKRGLTVRNAYMWTDPVVYRGATSRDDKNIAANAKEVFSVGARVRDELSLCTDGAVTYLVNKQTKQTMSVPLSRVHGVASDSFTGATYAVLVAPYSTKNIQDAKWYVLHDASWVAVEDPDHETDTEWRAVYVTVNKLSGEHYGKPDLISALYYAQAYKEYLETAHLMTKALARIAYKAKSVNARQQQAVVSKMSSSGVGGTASVGMGQDITAVSKAGAGVDFGAGAPLAAMVSAALDIPLSVLLTDGSAGGRQGAEAALEDPTFKALELRRLVHADIVAQVSRAMGINCAMEYGAINNDQVHRRVQSLVLAYENGALHQLELRAGVLQVLQVAGALDVSELPDAPETSNSVGALSDGTNDNRENPTEA